MNIQQLLDSIMAKAQAIQDGKCPECGADEWVKSGLPGGNGQPGIWDYECECCGYVSPVNPHKQEEVK